MKKKFRNKDCKECPKNKREDAVWLKGYNDGMEAVRVKQELRPRNTLYKFSSHPYIKIETYKDKLIISFQDSMSSYSKWYEIIIKFDKAEKRYSLLNIK